MQPLHETLERVVRLLARAHDLLALPSSAPLAADLVEDAYLLAVTARALAQQRIPPEVRRARLVSIVPDDTISATRGGRL